MPVYFLQLVFFTVDRKSSQTKNIFSKHDLYVLFISFFSKMYNKKLVFILGRSQTTGPSSQWCPVSSWGCV